MRNTISALTLVCLATALPGAALAKASKEENIGIGAGGVIGAAAGGPVGFIIGAAIGAKVGDSMHRKDEQIETLADSLDESQVTIGNLKQDIGTLDRELDRMQHVARPELVSLLQAGIEMDLLFRTDEFVLADTTGSRLAELGSMLASMPDIHVQLDGFADERGDSVYNQNLSEMRVEFVRDQLIAAGVSPSRIDAAAHGETPAQDQTADSYALERRVSLTLYIDDTPSFASNPE